MTDTNMEEYYLHNYWKLCLTWLASPHDLPPSTSDIEEVEAPQEGPDTTTVVPHAAGLIGPTGHAPASFNLAETDVVTVADDMMDEAIDAVRAQVEETVQQFPVEWRFRALRRMLVGLVQQLRDRAARLRILLQVVSTYTPQPLHLDGSEGREGIAVVTSSAA